MKTLIVLTLLAWIPTIAIAHGVYKLLLPFFLN